MLPPGIKGLKSKYSPHNEERGTFIEDIPSQEGQFTFEAISDSLKTFSKSIKEVENMSLKNKVLVAGWLDINSSKNIHKNVRGKNLPG